MQELGLNIEEIDKEYERSLLKKKKSGLLQHMQNDSDEEIKEQE